MYIIIVANKYACLKITRRLFMNDWEAFKKVICFFKQKTAYEIRISDWSSDVCSSDLGDWSRRRLKAKARKEQHGGRCALPHLLHGVAAGNEVPYVSLGRGCQ